MNCLNIRSLEVCATGKDETKLSFNIAIYINLILVIEMQHLVISSYLHAHILNNTFELITYNITREWASCEVGFQLIVILLEIWDHNLTRVKAM